MKYVLVLMTLLFSTLGHAQVSDLHLDYKEPKALFVQKCSQCHGNFEVVPKFRFLSATARFFDLKNDGRNQKVPPRMAGVRITTQDAVLLRKWILQGAPDLDAKPTITPEQAASILK